jgi:hypothetical protein
MKSIFFINIFLFTVTLGFSFNDGGSVGQSLNQQYQNLSSTCETIDGFRMMKLYKMDQFWKIVQDSLRGQRIAEAQAKAAALLKDNEIASLNADLTASKDQTALLEKGVDSIIVLGKEYSKKAFVVLAGSTVFVLVVLCVVLLVISRLAYKNYRDEKSLHQLVFNEFENYKHISIEKQMKLCRELQDYRNRSNEVKKSA